MIILDASALVELILSTPAGKSVAVRIADPAQSLHAPHLADVEVAQVLRRYAREGDINAETAAAALDALRALDLQRHPHDLFLERVWALRGNLSAYDAVYVALAELLDGTLLTGDGRLSRAPGITCAVEVIQTRPGTG